MSRCGTCLSEVAQRVELINALWTAAAASLENIPRTGKISAESGVETYSHHMGGFTVYGTFGTFSNDLLLDGAGAVMECDRTERLKMQTMLERIYGMHKGGTLP